MEQIENRLENMKIKFSSEIKNLEQKLLEISQQFLLQ